MRRLLVALLAALGVVPATASAGLELGLQDDAYLSSADPRAWQLTRELRPDVIRYNVDWSSIARARPGRPSDPGDPAYDWTASDGVVENAARQGARVLLTIVQAPAWANGGGPPRTAPRDARDFGTFCGAVAKRYSGSYVPAGAEAPLPRVTSYTVWNEPNRGQFLEPQGRHGLEAPMVMARLMRACAGSIEDVTSDARVAIGPLASRGGQGGIAPIAFLARYRAAGGPRPAVVALNPYLGSLLPEYRGPSRPGQSRGVLSAVQHGADALELARETLRDYPIDRVLHPVMNSLRMLRRFILPFSTNDSGAGASNFSNNLKRKLNQLSKMSQNTIVNTRATPSVTDLYSFANPFCAASAITTMTRISAMPIVDDRRGMTKRRIKKRERYIIVPRRTISARECVGTNSSDHSIKNTLFTRILSSRPIFRTPRPRCFHDDLRAHFPFPYWAEVLRRQLHRSGGEISLSRCCPPLRAATHAAAAPATRAAADVKPSIIAPRRACEAAA
jgi:hypothetical protein